MESESPTNRKGFIKRAGLALAAVFVASATSRTSAQGPSVRSAHSAHSAHSLGSSSLSNGGANSALTRVHPAKGAIPHQTHLSHKAHLPHKS